MFETVESEKGKKKHIIDKSDNVLYDHWIVLCGKIYSGPKESHYTNNACEIKDVCRLCLNILHSEIQGVEYEATGTIHGIQTYDENFQEYVVTFCGFKFRIGESIFSDAKNIISINPKEINCGRCQKSSRFKRIMSSEPHFA